MVKIDKKQLKTVAIKCSHIVLCFQRKEENTERKQLDEIIDDATKLSTSRRKLSNNKHNDDQNDPVSSVVH